MMLSGHTTRFAGVLTRVLCTALLPALLFIGAPAQALAQVCADPSLMQFDVSSKIVAAAIHHRPLGPVLRFSAEIRDRLAGVIPADCFLKEST